MPRAPAFKIAAIADLLRQLEYAPAETRRRQMDAAERLVADLDPAQAYPDEFVIFRITGYRSDRASEPVTFVGEALRADLANLIQRLSAKLDLPAERDGEAAVPLEQVAARLNVSTKTIQRYRTQGLVCHVVRFDGRRGGLACYEDALRRFVRERTDGLARASRFTRASRDTVAIIIEAARRLRAERPLSLNAAAAIIARQHGRALETIRQMLHRHDRSADEPLFLDRGPLRYRQIQVIHRAWIRGVDLKPMARHFGKSRSTIHRAITRRRVQQVCGLEVTFVNFPTFELEGAAGVILSPAIAAGDLLALPPHHEATALLQWASNHESVEMREEDSLLAAWNLLRMRAARGIDAIRLAQDLDQVIRSNEVDAIETDLRWSTLLHRRLALLALPAAIRRIEANLGRALATQPAEHIVGLLRLAVEVACGRAGVGGSLANVDPTRGQRLERVVAFDMERELAKRGVSSAATRAAARHVHGGIPLPGLLDQIDPWVSWLDPWRGVSHLAAGLPQHSRSIITRRFGWEGGPPRTLTWLAGEMNVNPTVAARRVQKAIRELRAVVRRGGAMA